MFHHSTSHHASGIVNGAVPESVRPDGSVRKEIRIRPGYTPPEDVTRYRNARAEAFKGVDQRAKPTAADEEGRKKKKRSRGKGKKADADEPPAATAEEHPEKRARALRKKVRQATDLKAKKEAGILLLPEQEDKLSQLGRLEEELSSLSL
ncbi:hypothetical protein SAICODRAFT_10300 [Saitoella complicata NRRL Y-17804]|uniref:WIBG Mago-binding domain-containing protein n=1 Tax=Saitoella complicata (strain BCRC 22490 / CBS 7301 / JCM 7358 / NBRC 10748 / NRRL Y-17804) TaxID=698492 RepID=A0A0E9NJ24_SAICN|nr:uncharacterized protein SAICODRAFT_10300 [Saitoella complicata NRRL Y-17804]ODQ50004.1 hypothetical protein SAICODRAFT_10300 [Saitoella complicata NRRL Y-17804]GAO49696.1 hypothetical protein G7K_3842-t1 [Saitoella complicata NRRL Y-17804]